ncbi:hypothetical protein ACOGYQ_002287 [Edwardsiella piscicida]|uniref:hypothetical protein n=1 Tax=Edwardsiella piscicida TaxID=1263550 RepID=UPI001056E421|nr:hypothetical protein [Edwardsiella piscicida]EKS7767757.1 hypothetical protein [Edwardsiella piscicida]UBU79919.1 hypothetical protein A9797_18485 [Edwardsiella piscicida]UCQ57151.1 hypothetical protein DCF40_15470 [Edwardsiella piscicida]
MLVARGKKAPPAQSEINGSENIIKRHIHSFHIVFGKKLATLFLQHHLTAYASAKGRAIVIFAFASRARSDGLPCWGTSPADQTRPVTPAGAARRRDVRYE